MSTDGQDSGTSFEQQVRTYLKVLKRDPRSRVFAPLAALLSEAGHHQEAEKVCRRGLAGNPDFADGHAILAEILLAQGRLAEALQASERALQLYPESAESQALAAEILHSLGQDQRAVERCMHALDISPRNERARRLIKSMGVGVETAPAKKSTGAFRAVAPTSPARRSGPADLVADNLAGLGREGSAHIDAARQPFAALSAGSHSGADDFEVPTAPAKPPGKSGRQEKRPDTPALPPHPPLEAPETPEEKPPLRAAAPSATAPVSFVGVVTGQLPLVHLVQNVVERVGDGGAAAPEDDVPLRVKRGGRLAVVAGVLAFAAVLAWLVVLAASRSSPAQPGEKPATGASDTAKAAVVPRDIPGLPQPAPVAAAGSQRSDAAPPEAPPEKHFPPHLKKDKASAKRLLKNRKKSRQRRPGRRIRRHRRHRR